MNILKTKTMNKVCHSTSIKEKLVKHKPSERAERSSSYKL
jgi:hypothetical protein